MVQRSVIKEASKIRMLKFSNSFFSKLVQWQIENYSTDATNLDTMFIDPLIDFLSKYREKLAFVDIYFLIANILSY